MTEHCNGCATLFYRGGYCDYRYANVNGICPCTQCIVKAMCDIDCEDFGDYSDRPRCKDLLNRRLYGEGKNSI